MISMAETTQSYAIQEAIDLLNRDISSHDVPYAIGRARAAHRALLQATQAIGESMADADPDSHGTKSGGLGLAIYTLSQLAQNFDNLARKLSSQTQTQTDKQAE